MRRSTETNISDSEGTETRAGSSLREPDHHEFLRPKCPSLELHHPGPQPSVSVPDMHNKIDIAKIQAGTVKRDEFVHQDHLDFDKWIREHMPAYLKEMQNMEDAARLFQAAKNIANNEEVDPVLHSALRSAFRQMKTSGRLEQQRCDKGFLFMQNIFYPGSHCLLTEESGQP